MLQGQALYGSDRALCDDGFCALGRNLFANLPEDAYDNAPCEKSDFRLVADVRLDNRPELAASLGLGSADQSRLSDSALLFEALLKWGDEAVNRLVGEFAFAFWDGASQRLLLGRDFMGLRPLYFHQGKNFFGFASMPSGLHALDEVPYDLDTEFMVERLGLLPHAGRKSYFRDIERVEPAHILRIDRNGIKSFRYWRPPGPTRSPGKPDEFEEGLRAVLDVAVAAQLRGTDGLAATQLSGGLDSSTVTATVARHLPDGKVIAYTACPRPGFAGPTPRGTVANEAQLAAATARRYPNIEHVLVESSGESPLAWLDRNFLYQQQPMANLTNAGWGQAIHRAASASGSKVIFKASAGNLSISYSGMEWLPLLLSQGRLLTLIEHWSKLARNGVPLLSLGSQTFGPFVPAPLWRTLRKLLGKSHGVMSFSSVSRAQVESLERKAQERALDLADRPHRDPHQSRVWALFRGDGGNAYKGVLAEWGLSVRDPTADRRVVEYCLTLPIEEFVRGGVPRSLARRAFSDRLPPEVARSRVRGLQSADWYEALDSAKSGIEQEIASIARCATASDAINLRWLEEAADSWPSGGWNDNLTYRRYRLGLLRGISAGHFMRKVKGTN